MNDIIKCPYCGSSSQVRIAMKDLPYNTEMNVAYNCGCGCKFVVTFYAKDYKTIKAPEEER